MNKKFTILLASTLAAIFSIVTFSEAQTVTTGGLNAKQENIVTIAAFTASGDLQKLKTALNDGLDAGLTINEIKEILVQMYAYAGFPRSLNGINTFIGVLEERDKKGIKDVPGKEPSSIPANRSSIELGTEIQTHLIGAPATGKYITFAPAIDAFLKGHLFGDIFGRDNLDYQSRELATISALASIEGVNPQLQSHFNVGLNTGLTEAQLRSLITVLEANVGKKEAANASETLGKVLSNRQAEQRITIARSGSLPSSQGSAEYFSGSVKIDTLFKAHEPARTTGGLVTFQPGARTAWHSHPLGQTLIVTAGTGRIQQWGGPIEEIRQGDVVRIPPGVKHWHGAAPNTAMTHIAIAEQLNGNAVEWLEKVSDEQYNQLSSTRKRRNTYE
ncbi:(R)-mandelonitrile lyase [Geotalea uraniireducens]|uniref:Cupin 2, conserved barrel domain protein n=1 Tax=Geotalea uraniireducens (strain Rf4) TaxID=351605 RepID=A5G9P5_GEOUR|nr:carboxymuconolactone decarboxylase family protein [Geotalea uraniireducens]ABQ28513.1 Cupin 2, conserved barrel domain protein [Geotalea uraniireducens Rf4]